MPEIKFERYERECAYNQQSDSKINDFRVIIDGELRAVLVRRAAGRGYWLHDADYRPILSSPGNSWSAIEIKAQSLFKSTILRYLTLIPDAQTLEEIRASEAAKERQEAADEAARQRRGRMNNCAQRMYAMLRQLQKSKPAGVEIAGLDEVIQYIDYNKGELHDSDLD